MSTKNKKTIKKIGVILMTYGSPKTLKQVPQYLKNVYGGKTPNANNVKEFQRRYKIIGGSPLIKITKQQAKALEKVLNEKDATVEFKVSAGMRFSHPFIEDEVKNLGKFADEIIGIIMSPQYSELIMKGYVSELKEAVEKLDKKNIKLKIAKDWHLEPLFLSSLSFRVTEALKNLPKDVPVLFSAHSMPKRVIDNESNYIKDLKETALNVAKLSGLKKNRWMFCYQSAGHTPEEWLKPDFEDIMPVIKKKGKTHVLIAPVQFLSDHLEILYDVNIGAREQAEKNGIKFARTESLNTLDTFIKSLSQTVKKTMKAKNILQSEK
jgi:ferrochelatase